MIKVNELKQILDLVREHELAELELESEGLKLRVRKDAQVTVHHAVPAPVVHASVPIGAAPAPMPVASVPAAAALEVDTELAVVKSPIVGTFYRSPEPSAAPFVEAGDSVRKGQTLCIIEAMKMMNNIDSEYDGTLVKVYVENGQPVQFGERLFAIKAR
jgi:acetyl-CoA carboxylase biotin carboxyl carrier protein